MSDGSSPAADQAAELARLRAERDQAVRDLDRDGRRTRRRSRGRRVLAGMLVVLFAILLPLTVTAGWAHRTVLDTNTYVSTVAPIAGDPAVTAAASRQITDQLYATLQPQQIVAQALPPRAAFLAGPIANGAKSYVQQAVDKVLSSPQFQQIWVTANRFAHTELVAVLRGHSEVLATTNGQVTLNLVPALNAALQNVQAFASSVVGHPITIPSISGNELPAAACAKISAALSRPLPATCGQIALFPAAKLVQARRAVQAFDRGVLALLIVTPLVFLLAMVVSPRRRRTLLQLALGGALGLVVVRRALKWLQSDLISHARPENQDARSAIVHGVLNGFFTLSAWILVGALAIALLGLVTGPYRWAVSGRRSVVAGSTAVVGLVRTGTSAATDDGATAFVRAHVDALSAAGVVVVALVLLGFDIGYLGILILAALLAAYEWWLHRIRQESGRAPDVVVLADAAPSGGPVPAQAAPADPAAGRPVAGSTSTDPRST